MVKILTLCSGLFLSVMGYVVAFVKLFVLGFEFRKKFSKGMKTFNVKVINVVDSVKLSLHAFLSLLQHSPTYN